MAEKKKTDKSTWKKILLYIRNYRILVVLSILLAAISALLTLYVPIIIGDTIDLIVAAGNVKFDLILVLLKKTV